MKDGIKHGEIRITSKITIKRPLSGRNLNPNHNLNLLVLHAAFFRNYNS